MTLLLKGHNACVFHEKNQPGEEFRMQEKQFRRDGERSYWIEPGVGTLHIIDYFDRGYFKFHGCIFYFSIFELFII